MQHPKTMIKVLTTLSLAFVMAFAMSANATNDETNRALAAKAIENGVSFYNNGQYDQAITAFTKATVLDPGDVVTYVDLATSYMANGQQGHALASLDQAIARDPEYSKARIMRANIHVSIGDYTPAFADYERILSYDPAHENANNYLALALSYKGNTALEYGQYDNAIADFTRAISHNSQSDTLYKSRGQAYLRKQDFNLARDDFHQAVILNPDDPLLYYMRGNAYLGLQQFDAAIADYKTASGLSPENETFANAISFATGEKQNANSIQTTVAANEWKTYQNGRFGFTVSYPAHLFTMQPPPENNDGRRFNADDDAYFITYGRFNTDFWTSIKPFQADKLKSDGYEKVTYKKAGKDWLVLSGYRGNDIFYEKYIFSCKFTVINVLYIVYDKTLNSKYSPLISRLNKGFKPGVGYDIDTGDCS